MFTFDCFHRHIFLLHVYKSVSLARMRRYMQLAYLLHRCAKSFLSRDRLIADCSVRHPGVERPFSSYFMCDALIVSLIFLYRTSHTVRQWRRCWWGGWWWWRSYWYKCWASHYFWRCAYQRRGHWQSGKKSTATAKIIFTPPREWYRHKPQHRNALPYTNKNRATHKSVSRAQNTRNKQ